MYEMILWREKEAFFMLSEGLILGFSGLDFRRALPSVIKRHLLLIMWLMLNLDYKDTVVRNLLQV